MRTVWDIHGGIHPAQQKEQSTQTPITSSGIPNELIYPLSQHIGAPASPVVNIGDDVLKGQIIAEAKGVVSVPVHASTSGKIIAIEHRPVAHPSSMTAPCIILKPDQKDKWIERHGVNDYKQREKSELLNIIRQSGIAGMGGAGFPTAVKLAVNDKNSIETLIINGTECEPYITADDMLMRERAKEIIEGIKILQYLIAPTKETLIGIEDNKPEAIAILQQATKNTDIEVVTFATKYPSGGEKQLIQILTGKEVKSGGLPAHIGIVCQNIGTTAAIYNAICLGEPLISRVTTVTGDACKKQQNVEVLLGTPADHLLKLCEFDEQKCSRLIMGGPMMGFTLNDTQVPVVKTTNCLLAPTTEELPLQAPAQACIRCGMCAQACPVSLLPQQLYWFSRGKEYDKLEAHNIMDCIECGACSYVCPSNIPLVQYYRASKASIQKQKQDHLIAEHSKQRFEARKARLEQQEQEKEAKRQARKKAAEARAANNAAAEQPKSSQDNAKADVIKAAIARTNAKKAAADPAQMAIQKAQNKRENQSNDTPLTKDDLEQSLAKIEKRLTGAQEKLNLAREQNSDKIAAFETAVEKTHIKYQQAKEALDAFISDNSASTNETQKTSTNPEEKLVAVEQPVDDIVARALAKRAAASTMTDEQKRQNAVKTITTRLEKAKEKLAIAEEQNSDNVEILTNTVEKLTLKLADAKAALAEKV